MAAMIERDRPMLVHLGAGDANFKVLAAV